MQRILAAGDHQRPTHHFAGRSRAIDAFGVEQFDALAVHLEPGAGYRIEGADLPLDLLGRTRPVDPRFGLVDLLGVSRAVVRLWPRWRWIGEPVQQGGSPKFRHLFSNFTSGLADNR